MRQPLFFRNPTLRGFIRKEFRQVLRDKRMRLVLFVIPIIQLTLFGVALSTEVKNIRLAGLYRPSDSIAQDIQIRALASGWFIPPGKLRGTDPIEWIRSGAVDAAFVAPEEGLTSSIQRGQGRVQLLIDATNAVRAQQVQSYFKAILSQVMSDQAPRQVSQAGAPNPLTFDIRVLYNPAMVTAVFMVPGVMSMILCVLTIILTAMSLAKEKEAGTFEMLVAAPVSTSEILFGKTLPYILLAMIDVVLIVAAAILIFKVPLNGSIWALLIATLFFVCTTVSIGTLISTVARTQQQAMMGGFLFLFPAVLLSGIMFPIENMPPAMKVIAALNPMKYFVTLLRSIMLKGGDMTVFLENTAVLALIATLTVALAFRRFRHTLN